MRFMLIDGNSLAYRAFHALPTDLVTASGQVTNAVFGFTSMFINLVRDHQPDAIAVAFDRPEPTWRHERNADYKANRDAAPDILAADPASRYAALLQAEDQVRREMWQGQDWRHLRLANGRLHEGSAP